MSLVVPFSRFLLIKSWRQCLCLVGSICLGGILSHCLRPGAPISGCLLLMVIIALFSALSLTETHQQDASGFPSFMFLLPMSNLELVVWPMALSAALMALAGVAISVVIFGPVASFSDTWWLAPYLAGNVSLFQAVTWLPLKRPELRTLLAFAVVASIVAGPLAFGAGVLRALPVCLAYSALILVSAAVCVHGVGRARRGLAIVGSSNEAYRIPDFPPFPSRLESQAWFEEKRNGLVMKVLAGLLIGVFVLLATLSVPHDPAFTQIGGIQISQIALLWTFLILAFLPFFGYGGCCASGRDNIAKDRSLLPFLALRPLTTLQIVEAKALMSIRMALRLAVPSLAAAFAILLLPTSLDGSYRPTIVPLAHLLSVPQAAGLFAAYCLVLLGGIKASVSGMWTVLGRVPHWLTILLAVIPFLALDSTGAWLFSRPEDVPKFMAFLPNLIYFLAAIKLIALVPVTIRLRASRLVPETLIGKWFLGCAVAGVALFWQGCHFLPPAAFSRWSIAAEIFVILPLVRVMLAPLAVHRGRHG